MTSIEEVTLSGTQLKIESEPETFSIDKDQVPDTLSLIVTINGQEAVQVFSQVRDLVALTLNLWSPDVSSTIQLLGPTQEILTEHLFQAKLLESPSVYELR